MTTGQRLSVASAAVAEAVVIVIYVRFEAGFHLVLHFLVGGSAVLVLRALARVYGHTPGPATVWVIRGHLVALIPDFLFRIGLEHAHWMDFFIWHIEAHYLPGRLMAWAAIFLVALAADLWADRRRPWPAAVAFVVIVAAVVTAHGNVPAGIEADSHALHVATMLALPAVAIAAVTLSPTPKTTRSRR